MWKTPKHNPWIQEIIIIRENIFEFNNFLRNQLKAINSTLNGVLMPTGEKK